MSGCLDQLYIFSHYMAQAGFAVCLYGRLIILANEKNCTLQFVAVVYTGIKQF